MGVCAFGKKLKIAFLLIQFPVISETFILNQVIGLLGKKCEVNIFSLNKPQNTIFHRDIYKYDLLPVTIYRNRPGNCFWRVIKAFGLFWINIYRNPLTLLKSLNFFKYGKLSLSLSLFYSALCFLGKNSYDIIHCHFGPAGNLAVALKDIGAIDGKIITSFHGFDTSSYVKKHGESVYRSLFEKGDLCIANSQFTMKKIELLGCNKKKIVKMPVGLKLTDFPFFERRLEPEGVIKIITVARLVEVKGIEYTIKALAKVRKTFPNIKYYIVGGGALEIALKTLIAEEDVGDIVTLKGWMTQEELRRLYDVCHIFILSSVTAGDGSQEGQGLVLQEAQAKGLPVISTFSGAIPEGVLEGKSGFLVNERDVDALAERIRYLIENPELWPEFGRAGRMFVEASYSIEKLNSQLVNIYRKVMNEDFLYKENDAESISYLYHPHV
jgi:colanic acid/amylovoran biosynthesis glycosyltransferase